MGRVKIVEPTPEAMRAADERGAAASQAPTAVMDVRVTRLANDAFVSLILRDGTRLAIPVERVEELAGLSADVLETIEVSPARDALRIAAADVDVSVPGLLTDLYGGVVARRTGGMGGRAKTPAKVAAARKNGRKGGRPIKPGSASADGAD